MVFLAILIPVVVESLNLSTRAAAYSDRKTTAAQLAENKLNENILFRTAGIANRETTGEFGPDFPGYRYEIRENTWSSDSLTEITVEVFFTVQGHEDSIALTTLFDDNSTATSTTTTTGATATQ